MRPRSFYVCAWTVQHVHDIWILRLRAGHVVIGFLVAYSKAFSGAACPHVSWPGGITTGSLAARQRFSRRQPLLCRSTFQAGQRHIEEKFVTKPRAPAVYASQNSRGSHTLSGLIVDQRSCSPLLHLHKAIWPLRQHLRLTASEWLRRGTGSRHNVNNTLARGTRLGSCCRQAEKHCCPQVRLCTLPQRAAQAR